MLMLFDHVDKNEARDLSELFEVLDHNSNGLVDADDIISHVAKTRVAKHHATSMHMLRKVHRKATRAYRRLERVHGGEEAREAKFVRSHRCQRRAQRTSGVGAAGAAKEADHARMAGDGRPAAYVHAWRPRGRGS